MKKISGNSDRDAYEKRRKTILTLFMLIVTVAACVTIPLAMSYILHNKETGVEPTTAPTVTKQAQETVAPEATLTPTVGVTESVEPTFDPTRTPVTEKLEPTVTAVPTETLAPTATPTPSPMPTAIPTPAPTNTPVPTPTAVPTSTPTPLPVADETPILRVQMGDNVYYEYYEDGILVVTGTGSTWDLYGEDNIDIIELHENAGETIITKEWPDGLMGDYYVSLDSTRTIIIEEGITRIGDYALGSYPDVTKVSIPDSLVSVGAYGFREIGEGIWTKPDTVEWIGLDLSKIDAHEHAFIRAKGLDNMDTSDLIIQPTATPTPTPTCTPTPTPIPNPDNPRMCHSFKMGADATFEFWDNGYLYVKGTGKVDDKDELFVWKYEIFEILSGGKRYSYNAKEAPYADNFIKSIKYVVVEEGITYLGKNAGLVVDEIWLPESLMEIENGPGKDFWADVVHCYQNGKPVRVTPTESGTTLKQMFEAVSNPELAEKYKVIITEE